MWKIEEHNCRGEGESSARFRVTSRSAKSVARCSRQRMMEPDQAVYLNSYVYSKNFRSVT